MRKLNELTRRPGSKTPMVHSYDQSPLINFVLAVIASLGEVVRILVPQGLGNAKEEQTYSDTGTEDHGKIGDVTEFGLGIFRTKPDIAKSPG